MDIINKISQRHYLKWLIGSIFNSRRIRKHYTVYIEFVWFASLTVESSSGLKSLKLNKKQTPVYHKLFVKTFCSWLFFFFLNTSALMAESCWTACMGTVPSRTSLGFRKTKKGPVTVLEEKYNQYEHYGKQSNIDD